VSEIEANYAVVVLVIGLIVFLSMLVKSGLERTMVPPLVGFLILGFLIRLADSRLNFLNQECQEILGFLAKLGLITLLFRVGLESNLAGLLKQLRRASVVWASNVLVSGALGFATAFYVLDFSWVTSAVVGCALTATSVGFSVAMWEEAGALQSKSGELLIDVAELDDISAIVIMALIFAVLPNLENGDLGGRWPVIAETVALFLLKLGAFGAFCYLFSRFIEPPMTGYFGNLKAAPDPMLVVVAVAFMIAAVAGLVAFSLAIGAFFAGLVFSRDPQAVKMEASFLPLYELFSPFFFIGIGLDLDPGSMKAALGLGSVLLAAAAGGKILANVIPLWPMAGAEKALLIGVSMVPRAEIAMVIMDKGLKAGHWLVPPALFGAMVVVVAGTCILSPPVVSSLLKRGLWKKEES
jgi:Kef-type K+ transport system membrane component KefB